MCFLRTEHQVYSIDGQRGGRVGGPDQADRDEIRQM